ncbi:hypothetical protein JH146_0389 [Methanocaldococcus bathoardescens]|uniref:Uncharacterized protein n=1 Tax=Methanocaldococcus bathoardescens TaxID=1301915 RepID=A0A076LI92_9EURY|nr:hypothetical protein [Methanocaldococcus bathoardescens]AIJ05239.1 hypothetical protein JH146_0389 [Methanocaldococcus bathoardescens]
MNRYFLVLLILIFIFLDISYAEDVYVKLIPEEVVSNGEIIKFNITVENIPKIGDIKDEDYLKIEDGGCRGVGIIINYSDHLKPYGFNWSDICKKEKLKSYEFKDGTFRLEISFDNPIEEDFCIGEIMFIPVKEGETQLNLSGSVSSALGYKYDGVNEYFDYYTKTYKKYPNTKFFGAKVVIKGINATNTTMKLKEDVGDIETSSSSTIVNRIYVTPNVKEPEVVIKEINITEYQPVVNVVIEKKSSFKFLGFNLLSGILAGVLFGLIMSRFKII